MKAYRAFFSTIAIAFALSFAGGAFISADIDPAHWHEATRAFVVFAALFFGLPVALTLAADAPRCRP